MEQYISIPNNQVAILVHVNDNKNNTYTLIPESVSLGQIDSSGYFVTEDEKNKIAPLDDLAFSQEESNTVYYTFLESVNSLEAKYSNIKELSSIMYCYLKDISSKLNIALLSNGQVHVYSKDFNVISDNIAGEVQKHFEESPKNIYVQSKPEIENKEQISVIGLEKYLKERILANDEILENIATIIALNYTAKYKKEMSSILSIGPSGSGKTATFEAISEYLDIPLTIYDASSISAVGYVGSDISDVMRKIFLNAAQNKAKAEKSILLIDEIDKIAIRGSEVKDEGAQQQLLKLLDGYTYTFEISKNKPNSESISLDSSFMTIALSGAFQDLYDKKHKEKSIGFNSNRQVANDIIITDQDLVDFGMKKELIRRICLKNCYKFLTKDDLKQILTTSKNSPLLLKIQRYEREFLTEIIYTPDFIDALANKTYEYDSGASSLDKVVTDTFMKLDRYLLIDRELAKGVKPKKLILTPEIVENNIKFNI